MATWRPATHTPTPTPTHPHTHARTHARARAHTRSQYLTCPPRSHILIVTPPLVTFFMLKPTCRHVRGVAHSSCLSVCAVCVFARAHTHGNMQAPAHANCFVQAFARTVGVDRALVDLPAVCMCTHSAHPHPHTHIHTRVCTRTQTCRHRSSEHRTVGIMSWWNCPVVSTLTSELLPAACSPIRLSSISRRKKRLHVCMVCGVLGNTGTEGEGTEAGGVCW